MGWLFWFGLAWSLTPGFAALGVTDFFLIVILAKLWYQLTPKLQNLKIERTACGEKEWGNRRVLHRLGEGGVRWLKREACRSRLRRM